VNWLPRTFKMVCGTLPIVLVCIIASCKPVEIDLVDVQLYDSARAYFGQNNFSAAELSFQRVISVYPYSSKTDDSKYWLARTWLEQGKDATTAEEKIEFFTQGASILKSIDKRSTRLVAAEYYRGRFLSLLYNTAPESFPFTDVLEQYSSVYERFAGNEYAAMSLRELGEEFSKELQFSTARQYYRLIIDTYSQSFPDRARNACEAVSTTFKTELEVHADAAALQDSLAANEQFCSTRFPN